MKVKRLIWVLVLLGVAGGAALWLWGADGVRVEVVNAGSTPLREVVVRVTGRAYTLGAIASGKSVRRQVTSKGESHVEVDWQTEDGHEHHASVDCYFEGSGYSGTVRVEIEGDVVIGTEDDIRLWP